VVLVAQLEIEIFNAKTVPILYVLGYKGIRVR